MSPRYIGPYEILQRIGAVAYRLALPPNLSHVHDVFHISVLKKYFPDPTHVFSVKPMEINENLSYEEKTTQILDQREKVLRTKTAKLVKFLWSNHMIEEEKRESEDLIKSNYPHIFI